MSLFNDLYYDYPEDVENLMSQIAKEYELDLNDLSSFEKKFLEKTLIGRYLSDHCDYSGQYLNDEILTRKLGG